MLKRLTSSHIEASRRAERLPGFIIALANTELTYRRMIDQDGDCAVCGAHCSARTTPVFQHKSQDVIFCQICSQTLTDD